MTRSHPVTPLYEALEQYGRRARRLSEARMLVVDSVLRELGEDATLSDPCAREQLARRVVSTLQTLIETITDPVDRRIAEAILAAKPEFYDKTVEQRRAFVREHDLGFSDEQFKLRRTRILTELAMGLADALREQPSSPIRIFISGSYFDGVWDRDAVELGIALAELPVTLVAALSRPGRRIGYAMADALAAKGIYSASRVVFFSRTNLDLPVDADRRIGTVVYFGATHREKRNEMIRISQLAILFGGSSGAAEEVKQADMYRVPVVPLAFTGGSALDYWKAKRNSIDKLKLGGKPADPNVYALLNHEIHSIAMRSAVKLVRQALNLP